MIHPMASVSSLEPRWHNAGPEVPKVKQNMCPGERTEAEDEIFALKHVMLYFNTYTVYIYIHIYICRYCE